jgi:hypothetical protein
MRAPQVAKNHAPQSETDVQEQPEILDPREAEILKLVAADAPSHRGAWKRDSKAWQLFVRRQDGRAGDASIIHEELESSGDPVFGSDRQEEDDGDTELDAQNGEGLYLPVYRIFPDHI